MHKRFIVAVLASAISLSAMAAAQSPQPQDGDARRASYLEGDRAMAAKDWPAAETIFKKLFAEGATYDVALSLGQVEFRQNKFRDAAQHFAFAIAAYPPREKTETLQRTKQFLSAASKHIGTLHITVDQPGAEVRIDDEPIGTSPLPANTYVDAGAHTVEARLADHAPTKPQNITVAAGAVLDVDLKFTGPVLLSGIDGPGTAAPPVTNGEPQGSAATPVNPPTTDWHASSTGARAAVLWSGVGVTAVALGVGIGFALKASSASSDAKNAASRVQPGDCVSTEGSASCAALKQSMDDRDSANKVANISFAVAGVAAVATAATFFIWPSRRHEAAREIRVVPVATLNTGGLAVSGNF